MLTLRKIWRLIRKGYALRDVSNIIKYGYSCAPLSFETIWVSPTDVKRWRYNPRFRRDQSAMVIGGDWDIESDSDFLEKHPKILACKEHFQNGLAWEETGIFDFMKERIKKNGRYDKCTSLEDIALRYSEIDGLYKVIKSDNRLKRQAELNPNSTREDGGVHIHIGRNGEPIFGGGGFHRLAIAKILGLNKIPAQLGVVHPLALENDKFAKYKQP